jgi:hypothetical protein
VYLCVKFISFHISTIFLLDFGTVPRLVFLFCFSFYDRVNFGVILKSARDLPGQEITHGVLEYCLNRIFVEIIMEYDAK